MNAPPVTLAGLLVLLAALPFASAQEKTPMTPAPKIDLLADDANRAMHVLVDGKPFTSYIYPLTLEKPTLYPLRSARGTEVTRGFPMNPRPGERVDHPHHVGFWLNFGDVNGIDFWNNSSAIPADKKSKYGTIRHKSVDQAPAGAGQATLAISADWLSHDGKIVLTEKTSFTFRATAETRTIDRLTTLTAGSKDVKFGDNKEGFLGLRVARPLEQPDTKPEIFLDSNGRATKVPALNNAGVTGRYHSSKGADGEAAWGTRADWMKLAGKIGNEAVSLVMFDHPDNLGYPTYWHARGYGLFAANPLCRRGFHKELEATSFNLPAGKSITFRYRLLIDSRENVSDETLNREFQEFSKK